MQEDVSRRVRRPTFRLAGERKKGGAGLWLRGLIAPVFGGVVIPIAAAHRHEVGGDPIPAAERHPLSRVSGTTEHVRFAHVGVQQAVSGRGHSQTEDGLITAAVSKFEVAIGGISLPVIARLPVVERELLL